MSEQSASGTKTVELPPGHPGPDDAERVDEGDCVYCGDSAEYEVWFGGASFLACDSCPRKNAIHAQDLVDTRHKDTDANQPGDDDLVTDGGTSERVVIEGLDDADAAQVRDDLTDTGIREAAIERRDGGRRPWLVPAIGAAMLGAGTVATWIAARPVLAAARRHLADPDASAIRSIPTYLRELYIETDFIGATATGDAWMGTMLVVVGVALLAAWGWGR